MKMMLAALHHTTTATIMYIVLLLAKPVESRVPNMAGTHWQPRRIRQQPKINAYFT